jgi:hypothetical protein
LGMIGIAGQTLFSFVSINILGIKPAEDSNWVWIKGQQGMSCVNIADVHAIDLELSLIEL